MTRHLKNCPAAQDVPGGRPVCLFHLRVEDAHSPLLAKIPPVGSEHDVITMAIGTSLGNHVKASRLGRVYAAETGFLLASGP
jgi:hypothetical protein